jgi:predicted nucleic acid-binding protein
MIVVNTNIIAYLFLTSDHSAQAEKALLTDPHWAAPLLWRSELRSVLAHYMRKEILKVEDAGKIMDEACSLMENNEYDVVSTQVLHLISKSTLSAYDCEFVALAKDLGIKLVTCDKKISDQFPEHAISLENFINA